MVASGGYGAEIDLDKIPVSVKDLPPYVVACSETQERLMWIVPQDLKQMVLDHYNVDWDLPDVAEGACAAEIGKVIKEDKYIIKHYGEIVMNAKPCDITEGLRYNRPHDTKKSTQTDEGVDMSKEAIEAVIKKVIGDKNVASRDVIYETYDKDVQGISVIERGMADAGVIAPLVSRFELNGKPEQKVGVALAVAANPRYGLISAKEQGSLAVLESSRCVAAVGAIPWCITDCLNYGSPEDPKQMQELIDGIEGVSEALKSVPHKLYGTPVPTISGNVSLYNYSGTRAIPPTAVIGMLGKLDNYEKAITLDIKEGGSIYLLGERKKELGGSVLFDILKKPIEAGNLPSSNYVAAKSEIYSVIDAIDKGLLLSAHRIAHGGMITAILEMFFAAHESKGCKIEVNTNDLTLAEFLFSETGGFICQTSDDTAFENILNSNGAKYLKLGEVSSSNTVSINGTKFNVAELRTIYKEGLRSKL
jgi:phosphoribosylformylglycinamidine synthase